MFLYVAITPDSAAYLLHNVPAALVGEQQEAVEMEEEVVVVVVVVVVVLALASKLRQPSSLVTGIFSFLQHLSLGIIRTYICYTMHTTFLLTVHLRLYPPPLPSSLSA